MPSYDCCFKYTPLGYELGFYEERGGGTLSCSVFESYFYYVLRRQNSLD